MEIVNIEDCTSRMNVLNSDPCVMALGFFDGVHKGHRKIIETARAIARKKNLTFAVMTFFPHPSNVVKHANKIDHYISPLPMKKEIFRSMGVEKLFVVNFNLHFSKLRHREFIEQYIIGLECKHVVAGFDFTYGYKGLGDMHQMVTDSNGRFGITTVSKLEHNHEKISSTIIREKLDLGEVHNIPMYLEDYYSIRGTIDSSYRVSQSKEVLKIKMDYSYHLPKKGLYEVKVETDLDVIYGTCVVPDVNIGEIELLLYRHARSENEEIEVSFIKKKIAGHNDLQIVGNLDMNIVI